jgi:hypothetical protein
MMMILIEATRDLTMAQEPIGSIGSIGPAIADALKKGNKVEAIKLLRQASGLGLTEAKQLIDRYETAKLKTETAARTVAPPGAISAHAYKPRPGLSPGQVAPTGGSAAAAVVIAIIAAAAGAAYFLVR